MNKKTLQKIISESGFCSRRKAEALIEAGEVVVNGEIAEIGAKANSDKDTILIRGKKIAKRPPKQLILLNKPKRIICSCFDTHGRKTVLDLLPNNIRQGMHPIGRLDYKSRGAILITNNGDLTLKLTHPRYSH